MADHVGDQEPEKLETKAVDPKPAKFLPDEPGSVAADDVHPEPGHPEVGAVAPTSASSVGTTSEWTASDGRGPLNAAGDPISTHGGYPDESRALSGEDGVTGDPSVETHATTEAPASMPQLRSGSRSRWPIAAGIVVGAIIGAGSALVYTATQSSGSDADQKIAALSARVDSLQARPDPEAAIDSLKSTVAGLDGKVGSLQHAVGTAAQADKTQPAPGVQAGTSQAAAGQSFDPAPLAQKIQALQSGLDDLKAKQAGNAGLDVKIAALSGAVDALKSEDQAAKASVADLGAEQKALAAKVTNSPALAVVADSLVSRIDQGAPYAGQVDALATIGADPARIAVLKENADKGVPSAKALATSFDPLADPIIATEHHAAAPNASFADKLKAGLFGMVSIRAVGDTTGDGIAARVAAIQADLAHDDVSGAYAVWAALPPAAKAKSESWGARAKTHAEAMDAARALQAQAIAELGTKKS